MMLGFLCSKGRVPGRETIADDCCPPVMEFVNALDLRQWGERQVNQIHLLWEVGRMKGVVGRPCDWTGAEDVERQANRKPERRDFGAARETRPVE